MDEIALSQLHTIDEAELVAVIGGEATRVEKWAMDGVDWVASKLDSNWNKKDCAGRYGYIGWGYGWSTGTASTLMLANKGSRLVGGLLGGATGLYGARLQSNYVENCKAKQAAGG